MIEFENVSKEIIEVMREVCELSGVPELVNLEFIPGNFIMSQILISITPQIECRLNITIPEKEYIFYDSKYKCQLTIAESTTKLLKILENGK
ncbi:MAG: hypothetical protein BGO86_02740 [Chryseobacterium sp. 36-9]|nr:MAG: hypothetical protein BGO86_02740 [Chryseobacterium sp. 36-9]